MKIINGALIIIFLGCSLSNAWGAEPVMTWDECVREALQNQPELISAQEKIKQYRADKFTAESWALPQISADLSGKKSSATSESDVKTTTKNYSYGLTGKQLLFDGFKTLNDIGAASATVRSAEYDYEVTSSDVRLNLRTAFVGLLKAQELVSITEDIAARRKQNLELVKLRYQAGREHQGSLLTAEADLAQAEFEVKQAKRNVALAQRQLIKELGRRKFSPLEVKGGFTPENKDRTRPDFEAIAENTPFLKELIAKKEAVRLGLKSAKADFFPQVYLNGSLGQSSSEWPVEGGEQWSAGVSLSFPLFEGGSRIAKVSKARAELNQAQADERSGRDSVIYSLEDAWTQFQDAMDKISVQKKYLEAAEERAKIANAQYSTGLISFDDWIIIEDNLVSSKKSFLDSQANMLVSEAGWIQAKGGMLEYDDR